MAARGGFGVSAAGESWLIPGWSFHTKPLSSSVPGQRMGSQPARTPGSARAIKDLPWEGAEAGQTLCLFRTGKEPRALLCLCQVFYFC